MSHTPPSINAKGFHCPFCKTYSHQVWGEGYGHFGGMEHIPNIKFAQCSKCSEFSIWHDSKMVYPLLGDAPLPSKDLPNEIKGDYEDASNVLSVSPRSSAALLRLAIEKLTIYILKDKAGKDLNDNIKRLVEVGLPSTIQQSLDILRVVGNNAVHPGQIDLKDDQKTAFTLFGLVNLIVDYMISFPHQTNSIYQSLPEEARRYIEKICPVGSKVIVDEDDGQTGGSYGRTIAEIYCNGISLNESILEANLATIYTKFCSVSEFSKESWAQHGCSTKNQVITSPIPKEIPKTSSDENNCDPSYPDFCIPPSPPDLDCKDVLPHKNFRALPPDPHRFDGNKDGIGC